MHKSNQPASILLAHINDTHSYFEPTSLPLTLTLNQSTFTPYVSVGGFARIATRVAQLKDDAERMKREFLFLHAGDCFQGTLYFSLFKGQANATLLNALNIDAMTLGNHELDMGNEPVAHFLEEIQFPLLSGNWDLSNESPTKRYPLRNHEKLITYNAEAQHAHWIEKKAQNETIAIMGLSIDKMAELASPDSDTPFVSALETAQNTVAAIHAKGINKIILLSHLGYDADIALAQQVKGIGLIVGGHSHRLQGNFSTLGMLKDDDYGLKINDTYIVQAGYYALGLGHCQVDFDADGKVIDFQGRNELLLGRRLFLDANMNEREVDDIHTAACDYLDNHPYTSICKKDRTVQLILQEKYKPLVRQHQKQIITHTNTEWRHVRLPDERGGSELAPLVAKAFVYSMRKRNHRVDFGIHNAGGVRASLNVGTVSTADIAGNVLPFAIPVGVYCIQGRFIAQLLEGAINNALQNGVVGTGTGSYPYAFNLQFDYQAEKEAGSRIVNLNVYDEKKGWETIDPNQYYYGASSAYTMKGKEGYNAILNMEGEGIISTLSIADAFIELLQDAPEILDRSHL